MTLSTIMRPCRVLAFLLFVVAVLGWRTAAAGPTIYYIHNDHLGTPRVVTDQLRDVKWRADYMPFGEAILHTEGIEMPLRMPGQYYDRETGLHYNYFRDYDPAVGRYIQSDPIGLAGGLNIYSYAGNNPVSSIDPLGLHPSLLKDLSTGEIASNGLQMSVGVFGCGIGCASFASDQRVAQASLETTLGGGVSICFSPRGSVTTNVSKKKCGENSESCGIYDPNCDNRISSPSLSAPSKLGFFVSGSKHPRGGYCVNLGPHMGLPLPGISLGGIDES